MRTQLACSGEHRLDRHQQHDRAHGVHRQHVAHGGLAGLEVDRAVNVQAVLTTALAPLPPALSSVPNSRPGAPAWGRMHRITGNDHHFIGGKLVQQAFILLDEIAACFTGSNLREIAVGFVRYSDAPADAAGGDLARSGLDSQCRTPARDPSADLCVSSTAASLRRSRLSSRSRSAAGNLAHALFVVEDGQTLDPIFLVAPGTPVPDRVVVHEQHLGNRLAAHAVIQQHQSIGAARQLDVRPTRRESARSGSCRDLGSRKPGRIIDAPESHPSPSSSDSHGFQRSRGIHHNNRHLGPRLESTPERW